MKSSRAHTLSFLKNKSQIIQYVQNIHPFYALSRNLFKCLIETDADFEFVILIGNVTLEFLM
jgi:hypothetical protein